MASMSDVRPHEKHQARMGVARLSPTVVDVSDVADVGDVAAATRPVGSIFPARFSRSGRAQA